MGFQKLGFLIVIHLCFFVQFLVKIDELMLEDGKPFVWVGNRIIFGWIFFSHQDLFSLNQVYSACGKDNDVTKFSFFGCRLSCHSWIDNAYVEIIMHLLSLDLLGQLLLLLLFFWI